MDTCYVVAESLATLTPAAVWQVENMPNELGYLAKNVSKKSVEDTARFPLAAYGKM